MKLFAVPLVACATLALAYQAGKAPDLNDGEDHGDAPYLLEDGWHALLNGRDLSGWHTRDRKPMNWVTVRGALWDRLLSPRFIRGIVEPSGTIINDHVGDRASDILTDQQFGDVELYLEFMVAKGSNSGVYLQSHYEVQIFDSYQSTEPMTSSDCGGIYHRWIDEHGVGGSAPSRNASRPPGSWQSYHIWFQAPRFDSAGGKTANARFLRVNFNGVSVQREVEVDGPTRAAVDTKEAPEGPLMLQGDHGPVAFRNIYWHALRPIVER